jgi:hypothetical protein
MEKAEALISFSSMGSPASCNALRCPRTRPTALEA